MPKRILYLCDPQDLFGGLAAFDLLRDSLKDEFELELLTLGRGGAARTAPLAVLRLLKSDCALVHAWGSACLKAAAFARVPVLFTPAPLASLADARWLRTAAAKRRVHVCCLGAEDHRTLLEHGVAPEACTLVRPGVKGGLQLRQNRDAVRTRLGLSNTEKAILVLGEAGRWADSKLAAQAASILNGLDPAYRMMAFGAGSAHDTLFSLVRRWSADLAVDTTSASFADLVAAADFALLVSDNAFPHLPVLTCMAAGVPLVGSATRSVSELLEDHHTALLAPAKPKLLAQRLLQLAENTPLQHKLADAARAESYELFSVSRFATEMRQLYSTLIPRT